eukprot:365204-Chlamydomonas_euryale.AAC.6
MEACGPSLTHRHLPSHAAPIGGVVMGFRGLGLHRGCCHMSPRTALSTSECKTAATPPSTSIPTPKPVCQVPDIPAPRPLRHVHDIPAPRLSRHVHDISARCPPRHVHDISAPCPPRPMNPCAANLGPLHHASRATYPAPPQHAARATNLTSPHHVPCVTHPTTPAPRPLRHAPDTPVPRPLRHAGRPVQSRHVFAKHAQRGHAACARGLPGARCVQRPQCDRGLHGHRRRVHTWEGRMVKRSAGVWAVVLTDCADALDTIAGCMGITWKFTSGR